jgi:hypothetical protein
MTFGANTTPLVPLPDVLPAEFVADVPPVPLVAMVASVPCVPVVDVEVLPLLPVPLLELLLVLAPLGLGLVQMPPEHTESDAHATHVAPSRPQ